MEQASDEKVLGGGLCEIFGGQTKSAARHSEKSLPRFCAPIPFLLPSEGAREGKCLIFFLKITYVNNSKKRGCLGKNFFNRIHFDAKIQLLTQILRKN